MSKPTVAIIGCGWGGYSLAQKLSLARFNIKVISPISTIQYTPLLASAACGLFNPRLAEDEFRSQARSSVQYYKAMADSIDLDRRIIKCKSCVPLPGQDETFQVEYDKIIIAPGCEVQTFGTEGVKEHALFLRTTDDAVAVQKGLLDMLDAASMPHMTPKQQEDMLNLRIVGGGPIGIEVAAELFDLWDQELRFVYPQLDGKLQMTIHDVASSLLSQFDEKLSEYAHESLSKKRIKIATDSHIERVDAHALYTKEDGRLPYGMLIWATGNKANALVEKMDVKKPAKGLPRILTDKHLRVLRPDGSPIEGTFALGDAADVEGQNTPALAEAALQKSEYLVAQLNGDAASKPFAFTEKSSLAYLGDHDGVASGEGENPWTGRSAWLAWRSGNLSWCQTKARKAQISFSWLLVWLRGREIARRY